MCNCRKLPNCVADIEYWTQGFEYLGSQNHCHYFETPDSTNFEPALNYSKSIYQCSECGQRWYIECLPEETPSPGFALKINAALQLPSDDEVEAAKEYLCILAHGGFDSKKCRVAGCKNHKLIGRELCHLHIPFP